MKLVTQEELDSAYNFAVEGAVKSGSIALAASTIASVILQRTNHVYRSSLTLPIKVGLVVSATLVGIVIGGEDALLNYDRNKYVKPNLEPVAPHSTSWLSSFKERRYQVIGGVWAASMVGSIAYSFSETGLKFSQKVVHARMYAQFATISALLLTAFISQMDPTPKVVPQMPSTTSVLTPPATHPLKVHVEEQKK